MKHWVTYHPEPVDSPMRRHGSWHASESEAKLPMGMLAEELPRPVPGKGYPCFHVLIDNFEWRFTSLQEIDVAIATLSARNMASVRSLSWWRNRLPGGMLSWRKRQKAVPALQVARQEFARELGWSEGDR